MKKTLQTDLNGNIIQTKIIFKKAAPKPYDPKRINDIIAERERGINDELSKQWLKEHGYEQ